MKKDKLLMFYSFVRLLIECINKIEDILTTTKTSKIFIYFLNLISQSTFSSFCFSLLICRYFTHHISVKKLVPFGLYLKQKHYTKTRKTKFSCSKKTWFMYNIHNIHINIFLLLCQCYLILVFLLYSPKKSSE